MVLKPEKEKNNTLPSQTVELYTVAMDYFS